LTIPKEQKQNFLGLATALRAVAKPRNGKGLLAQVEFCIFSVSAYVASTFPKKIAKITIMP
jgi:hypothetical protein